MFELVIERPEAPPRTLRLGSGVFVIGRQEGCEVHLDDKEVSRRHARLIVDGPTVVVEDLKSGNGTLVGGQSVEQRVLNEGDRVEIAPYTLTLRVARELPPPKVVEAPKPPPPKDWLEIVDGPGTGQRFQLHGDALSIGRHEDQHIRLPDHGVSRSHAMVVRRGAGWQARDSGSVNGILVNGERVTEVALKPGDLLKVGNTTLRYDTDRPREAPRPAPSVKSQGGSSDWVVPAFIVLLVVVLLVALFASMS